MSTVSQAEIDRVAEAAVEAVEEDYVGLHGPLTQPLEFRVLAKVTAGVALHMVLNRPDILKLRHAKP